MNSYSEQKFQELGTDRKVRVILDLIYKIEESWETDQKQSLLLLFKNYFQWFNSYESDEPLIKRVAHLEFKISEDMSLRNLLDIAVPLERHLNLAVKDEHIFKVKKGDGATEKTKQFPLCFVLDHLRSSFNVGSLFRTAECLGVEHIYLIGYTPTPEDKGVQKTAMGTDQEVSWSSHNHLKDVIDNLKNKGYLIAALETAENSIALNNFEAPKPLAFLVGNERFGILEANLEEVDFCVEIPMMGSKNSLNVANSLSIASFEVIRQWMK